MDVVGMIDIIMGKLSGHTKKLDALTNNGGITGVVYLTQAQYDALPASKLTDGKEYNIVEV